MRAVILRSFLFVAGLVLVMGLLHSILLTGLRHKRTSDYGVWNRMMRGEVSADVLVSGSSRALVDFDCEAISLEIGRTCFNAGIDGSRLAAQSALMKAYLKHNRAPLVLLQTVDITSPEPLDHVYQPSLYVPYLNEPDIFRYVSRVDRSFWAHRFVPLYSFALDKDLFYGALNVFLRRDDPRRDTRRNGFQARDLEWDSSFDRFAAEHPNGISYEIKKEALDSLDELIRVGKQSGARVVLVYPPEFAENFRLTRNRDELFQTFRDAATRHGIEFWDYSDDPISGDRSWFYNSQHLTQKGARAFSVQLGARLKAILGMGNALSRPAAE